MMMQTIFVKNDNGQDHGDRMKEETWLKLDGFDTDVEIM